MALIESTPYILQKEFLAKLIEEGDLTLMMLNHPGGSGAGYANRTTFTLDTSDYDSTGDGTDNTTPMLDKTFFVTGIRIICEAAVNFGGLQFDGRMILNNTYVGNVAGREIFLDGMGQAFGTPASDMGGPSLGMAWGVYALPVRATIVTWVQATGGNDMNIFFIGYLMDRKY